MLHNAKDLFEFARRGPRSPESGISCIYLVFGLRKEPDDGELTGMIGEVDGVYDLCAVQCVSRLVLDSLEAAPARRSEIPHVDIVPETLQGEDCGLPADVPVCNVGLDA